jgi:hypothetical protein
MITPVYTEGLVLFICIERAYDFEPFLCFGDHGPYCRIDYGGV